MALPAEAFTLEGLHVEAERRCVVRGRDGTALQQVWDEARKALQLTWRAATDSLLVFDYLMFERDLALDHRTVLRDSTWRRIAVQTLPFSSLPADSLARVGFVVVDTAAGAVDYYAPDAAVLLSDEFMDGHCFRLRRGGRSRPGMVGLAFEPQERRHVADVRGVLWLDARSAELREMEFSYTGVETGPLRRRGMRMDERMGGRVSFTRLPSGTWMVHEWIVRWPVARMDFHVGKRILTIAPPFHAIRETGGSVLDTRPAAPAGGS